MQNTSLSQMVNSELHISHSQIFCFNNCPLKYQFQYIESRPMERVSIALPFGSAIHAAIEMYYRSLKNNGSVEPLKALCERFQTCLELDLEHTDVPLIFKKDLSDHKAAIEMGNAILKVFHENIAQTVQTAQEIVAVELPLVATLYTDAGQPTDFKLAGILDVVFRDGKGEILVVDNKTASKPMAQSTADDNGQMTAYAYLLAANKYVFPTAPVNCRFDVLRKLKMPKLEQVQTVRTAQHRKRFAKIAKAVLAAIDAGCFFPQPGWMCADCSYQNACKAW